jgi:integrase
MKAHRASQGQRRLANGEEWHDAGIIVDRGDGRPVNPDIYTRYFARMAKKLELTGMTPHKLRHYYGTELNRRGVDIKTISVLMGTRARLSPCRSTRATGPMELIGP